MVDPEIDNKNKDKAPDNTPDTQQTHGVVGSLREQSLKTAGVSFILADAALFTSGVMSGKLKEASGAVAGWTAGAIAARYGHPKQEKQLQHVHN